ncbi:hypothetical protein CTAYLR_000626 [Chrysophaeum taylorii]|uniref:Protein kinase domain-containing protein n=1 Tax=Chrysophaeum taylorii TaxID=2483200 RepID=A0AAD7U941_9STRA|nr:hypothetical protein CTAYLR_000626 [Chrysophaeum taylorii]
MLLSVDALSVAIEVPGGSRYRGIAECAGKLYCAPACANSVLVIDPADDTLSTIPIAFRGRGKWRGIAACGGKLSLCEANERVKKARRGEIREDLNGLELVRDVLARLASSARLVGDDDHATGLDAFELLQFESRDKRDKLDHAQQLIASCCSSEGSAGDLDSCLVEKRNEARAEYVRVLCALQDTYSSEKFARERGRIRDALEREVQCLGTAVRSLEKIRSDHPPLVDDTKSAGQKLRAGTALEAWQALEQWERDTDSRAITAPTDSALEVAWCTLRDVVDARGADGSCDAWEIAHRAALEAVDAEVKHWLSKPHPFSRLPVDAIRTAFVARLDECKANIAALNQARDRARDARREVDEIAAADNRAALGDRVSEPWCAAKERVRTSKKALKSVLRELEDAVEEEEDDEERSATVGALRERVRAARRSVHAAQRDTEDELSKLVALVQDHYPELGVNLKDALASVVTMSPALRSVVRQGRSPLDYERIPWPEHSEPSVSRHAVMACRYDGQACVLKQFHLRNASERRALEREVEMLVSLTHPNVAKLECAFFVENARLGDVQAFVQTPLYAGGTLQQWLARRENKIFAVSQQQQWGTLLFLNAGDRVVATKHVRALRQLLAALSFVHAKGVVHGDIKLDNALVSLSNENQWTVVLSDFDTSRAGDSSSFAKTTRAGGGTPAFAETLDGTTGFNGCFALTCHRPGCRCGFCAYCLADCGDDAHAHVGQCAHGEGLFPAKAQETLARAQRARRDRDLRAYLRTLPHDEARAMLVRSLDRELRDLGLDTRAYLPEKE